VPRRFAALFMPWMSACCLQRLSVQLCANRAKERSGVLLGMTCRQQINAVACLASGAAIAGVAAVVGAGGRMTGLPRRRVVIGHGRREHAQIRRHVAA
jgi:hypothetical protein